MSKPTVLFTTPVLKHPATGGPYLRIENSIKALSQLSNLYIYSRVSLDEIGGASALSFYKAYCKSFYFAPSTKENHVKTNSILMKGQKFMSKIINFFFKKIIKINLEQEQDYIDILKVANDIKADVIWLGFGNISYDTLKYIKAHSKYKLVVDTDSVWSRFILRELPYMKNDKERKQIETQGIKKEKEEKWGTQLADVTTAVSGIDAEYYAKLAKNLQQIHIFSNVIDVETYQNAPLPVNNFKKPCIYLAGTFWSGGSMSPMEDATRWMLKEVLPLVRQQIPDIHFYIVGSGSDEVLADINDPSVTITGRLPSVLPYLCNADVSLVPLRFESGTRFKILEAGACGTPLVSTTLGAEGLPVTHEKDILIADEPELFSNSIIKLIMDRDFAERMADNLKKLVNEKYSVESLAKEGKIILDYLKEVSKS